MSPYRRKLKCLQICWEPAASNVTVASNLRLLWLLTWIVLVEAVMLRYLKKSLGIVMTNILRAL